MDFPGTGSPHDGDELTLFNDEAQTAQGLNLHVTDPIDFPHIFAFNQRAPHRHSSRSVSRVIPQEMFNVFDSQCYQLNSHQ